jgi:hypothetical protein
VLLISPPASTSPVSAAIVVRPLHVAPSFRSLAVGGTPRTAELTLSRARIPTGGGSFRFYLVDPKTPSKGVLIGKLAFEGPPAPQVRDLRVHVELGAQALALLRSTASPAVKIVPRRAGNDPLLTQSIELHAAP